MDREQFTTKLRAYVEDLELEAVRLFDAGCAPEKCVRIAVDVVDARIIQRTRSCERLSLGKLLPGARN